ncbi:MAG: hypothetical protein LC541_04510 [Candidatus Thiodiazotropha sp.]|nr:hypothetical protein [Candidatus Thiodiazotropha sp.]MCM8882579.1 hypothetical protein [Candidatus Thiodiazotropha sp.]MCM8918770.1 hypothetical protein [Candidatus Thiodiazotropha sp.]
MRYFSIGDFGSNEFIAESRIDRVYYKRTPGKKPQPWIKTLDGKEFEIHGLNPEEPEPMINSQSHLVLLVGLFYGGKPQIDTYPILGWRSTTGEHGGRVLAPVTITDFPPTTPCVVLDTVTGRCNDVCGPAFESQAEGEAWMRQQVLNREGDLWAA